LTDDVVIWIGPVAGSVGETTMSLSAVVLVAHGHLHMGFVDRNQAGVVPDMAACRVYHSVRRDLVGL
jgi:hypothetical protein